jgi:hypothetical protein
MAPQIPKTTKQWNVTNISGEVGFDALKYSEQDVPVLGDSEVLVKRESQHSSFLNRICLLIHQ